MGVLNFNPYFKQKGDNDHFYRTKHYCSEITEISFPEDILAAEYNASCDVRMYRYSMHARLVSLGLAKEQ